MSHVISELKRGVNAQMLSEASKFLGESEENLNNGLGGIFAVLLSAVMKRADASDSSSVFQQLDRLVNMVSSRDGMLDNSSNVLSALKGEGELGNIASKFLALNLGDKSQDVIALVAKALGLKESSVTSLLNMAAPMVLGWFGHKAQEDNLSAQGLMSYLHSQSDFISKALPHGLGSMLGLGSLGAASASAARGAVNGAKCSGGACLKRVLLLLILLAAAFFIWKSCATKSAEEQITEIVAVPTQTVIEVSNIVQKCTMVMV